MLSITKFLENQRALENVRRPQIVRREPKEVEYLRPAPIVANRQTIIDLPRMCAIRSQPYISRYVVAGNRYEYSQSIRVTHQLRGNYEDNTNLVGFDAEFCGHEHCPWCGAYSDYWIGAIPCRTCEGFFCFGTTIRDYFTCPCGYAGTIKKGNYTQTGMLMGGQSFGNNEWWRR